MTKRISVAIVGTGFSGLAALKEFSQAGFDVTAFERFDCVAGIWAYNEDPEIRSVSKNTLINNSKYMVNKDAHVLLTFVVLFFRLSDAGWYWSC